MKYICTVCGQVIESDTMPEVCPVCGAKTFKVMDEENKAYADEHRIGVAKGLDERIVAGLREHFTGECSEVGMYLAMSRQADREGYPEIAEAFKRYALRKQTMPHASPRCWAKSLPTLRKRTLKCARRQNSVPATARSRLPRWPRNSATTPFTTAFTKWPKTKPATAEALTAC